MENWSFRSNTLFHIVIRYLFLYTITYYYLFHASYKNLPQPLKLLFIFCIPDPIDIRGKESIIMKSIGHWKWMHRNRMRRSVASQELHAKGHDFVFFVCDPKLSRHFNQLPSSSFRRQFTIYFLSATPPFCIYSSHSDNIDCQFRFTWSS